MSEELYSLPPAITMDMDGHIDNHRVIHAGLKDHEDRVVGAETRITSLESNVEGIEVSWDSLADKPTEFPAEAHAHTISEVTSLQAELDGKSNSNHTHTWSEISAKPPTFPPSTHTHPASQINSGTLDIGRLPIGTTASTVTVGNDPRLSDSRNPNAHTHSISDVTNLGSTLDKKADLVSGLIPTSQLPAISLTKPSVVSNRAGMLALVAEEGDVAVITSGDDKGSYMLGDGPSNVFTSWVLLSSGADDAVQSVNGQTGTVNLTYSDLGAAAASHTHTIANITNLQSALDGKAPGTHTHAISSVTGLQSAIDGKSDLGHTHTWGSITSKPSTFTPATHTHGIGDVTGLSASIDDAAETALWGSISNKPSTFEATPHGHTIAEVSGLQTALDEKALSSHTHAIANVTGLQTALDGKSASGHTHSWSSVTDKPSSFPASAHTHLWSEVTGKPSTYAPSAHSHPISDVTNLQTALDGKSDNTHTHAWSVITGKPSTFAPSAHTHAISDVTDLSSSLSTLTSTKMNNPSGTGTTSNFARGDGSWATITIANVSGLQSAIDTAAGTATWAGVSGKPSTFTPSAHSHAIADVTNLQAELNGKAASSHTHSIANVTSLQSALDAKASITSMNSRPALFSGEGAPPASIPGAVVGDWYINTLSMTLYKITGV